MAQKATKKKVRITAQAVGAYGEKAVEAEMLRRGWVPSNVNASIRNAADFDIFALKNHRAVHLRVKTCGPNINGVQFGFSAGKEIVVDGFSRLDFTILVRMGETRESDQFYVVPTRVIRKQIKLYRRKYLNRRKPDRTPYIDTGQWTLNWSPRRDRKDRFNYDLAEKWARYRDNWALLEGAAKRPS